MSRAKIKYDSFIGETFNGRKLLSYKHYYKPSVKPCYKGLFICLSCNKEFMAELDASIRNTNRTKQCYCRSCTKKSRVKI